MSGFNGNIEAGALHPSDVVNNLTSTTTDRPLSANMGKALNEAIAQSTATANANHLQYPSGTYICWGSAIITAGTDRVNIAFSEFAQAPIIVISANKQGTFRVNNVSTYYAIIACNEGNVASDETIYWVAFGTK